MEEFNNSDVIAGGSVHVRKVCNKSRTGRDVSVTALPQLAGRGLHV